MDYVLVDNEEDEEITSPAANTTYYVNRFDRVVTDGSGDVATIRLRVTALP